MLPFLKEGLAAGEKVLQIIDGRERAARLRHLMDGGVNVAALERCGTLETRLWEDAYLAGGQFDQYAMISLIDSIGREGKRYPGLTRLWANMEWALEAYPGVRDIVEYESRVNYTLAKYDIVAVCTYDLNRFSRRVIADVVRTHPYIVIGGLVRENPFYIPPDDFLHDFASHIR